MSESEKSLVILVEARELQPIFETWPQDMCLAICLLSDGECRLSPFHENELRVIVPRLIRNLDLSAQDVCVAPKLEGYASQPLHYSDQRRLLRLVGDQPDLADEAADYSVNYRYALEEGLAPARLLGMDEEEPEATIAPAIDTLADAPDDTAPQAPAATPSPGRAGLRTALPGFLRRSREQALGHPSPGAGFRSARQISADDAASEQFRVYGEKDGWIEIVKPDSEGSELVFSDPDDIYLRQDGKVIALTREQSNLRFQVPPTRLRIKAGMLPDRMRGLLHDNIGLVEVNKTGDYLFLHVCDHLQPAAAQSQAGSPAPAPAPEAAPVSPAQSAADLVSRPPNGASRRLVFSAQSAMVAAIAVAAIALIGLQLLSGDGASRATGPGDQDVNWERYQLSENHRPQN